MKTFFIALLWALIGASSFLYYDNTKKDLFLEYYRTENAVAVSPHDLKMEMDKGLKDTIIVDLRSKWEYDKEHIVGAISIPWIDATDKDAESQKSRIVSEFRKLPSDKRIIVHCYTHYCMLAKHVWLMLAEQGISVHELNIWWNEWRNEWDLWNGKGTSEWLDITKYIEWSEVKKWTGQTQSGLLDFTPCTKDGLAWC